MLRYEFNNYVALIIIHTSNNKFKLLLFIMHFCIGAATSPLDGATLGLYAPITPIYVAALRPYALATPLQSRLRAICSYHPALRRSRLGIV